MRAYLIDELPPSKIKEIRGFLKKNAISSSLDQIFWVRIPDDLLNETQFQHRMCQPHVFAVELGLDWLKLELFVRSLKTMRCDCPGYCTPVQKDFIFNFADEMIAQLNLCT